MEKAQLLSLLEKARDGQDIYIIARVALMLQGRGHSALLTETEKSAIITCLQNARNGNGVLGLEPGYELARWILICGYVFPEKKIRATADDIEMIQAACNSYINDRILKQVASLVHMGNVLNIPININRLPPKKRKLVEKLAATIT